MPSAIETPNKSIAKANRWRGRLSRPMVVRPVAAVSVLVGAHVAWSLAGWINAQVTWPMPFDLVPGAAVLVAAGATIAVARKRPGVALSGALLTFALAVGWSEARAYGWPALEPVLVRVSQTTAFAVSAIAGTIAIVVGALVVALRWRPAAPQDDDSSSTPPAI